MNRVILMERLTRNPEIKYGGSALMIHDKYPEMVNGWSKSFWARGYYVATVGNITEEAVKEYIQQQKEESKREDTRR